MTIKLFPGPEPIHGDAAHLPYAEQARCRAAALLARRTLPGPLGELVHRELTAYAEFGFCIGTDGLIPRLAAATRAMMNPPSDPTLVQGRSPVPWEPAWIPSPNAKKRHSSHS